MVTDLTRSGTALATKVFEALRELETRVLEGISTTELETFRRIVGGGGIGDRDCSALVGTGNLGADPMPRLNCTRCWMAERVVSPDRDHRDPRVDGGDEHVR
jgi:hypothetical protein